jgi:molecular chaperone GrpE
MSEKGPEEIFAIDLAIPEDSNGAPQTSTAVAVDEDMQKELVNLQTEVDRLKELYLRKMADFDNYRKRQEREMADFRRYSNADLIRECLPVVDNLERALAAPSGDGAGLRTGVDLVLKQFKEILRRCGLTEVDPIGMPFDPSVHEAIQRQEVEGLVENTVIHALQKGYLLGERLLRPALVIVGVPPKPVESTNTQPNVEGNNE